MAFIGNERQISVAHRQDYAVSEELNAGSGETDKVIRSGVPSSTFWHFEDFNFHGDFFLTVRLPTAQVNSFSQVAVSICELNSDGIPFIGNAKMEVHNVAPHGDGRIIVRAEVHWGSNLKVRLNYIIVN
ncbi:hypothetical protein AB0O22_19260 [Streptomyces sp. NPDC091204]|uniref:hypothetical protein n=1 Tax=Streptomyces sp. NPDC091204 TaxID=3155299 RepID=UPI00343112AF